MSDDHPHTAEKVETPELTVGDTVRISQAPTSEPVPSLKLEPAPDLAPGEIIKDKFRIVEKVGAGGMGSVYKATDMHINRTVAVKILSKQLVPDERVWQRFQQEAKTAGILRHTGIVAIHELDTMDDDTPFIVMDFVEGESLAQKIHHHGKLEFFESLRIVSEACDILDYAHTKGVIHRDVKPANMILSKSENDIPSSVQLVDFGIAKNTAEVQSLTQTGEVFGSPLYMSPEQCAGGKADARSDIYSLGCVLYEMLTGEPPYHSDSALSTAVQHLQAPIPSLAKELGAGDGQVQRVINRALAKDPAARYTTMAAFKADIDKLFSGRMVERVEDLSKPQYSLNDYMSPVLNAAFGIYLISLAPRITTVFLGKTGIEIFGLLELLYGILALPPVKEAASSCKRNIDRMVDAGKLPPAVRPFMIFVALILFVSIVLFVCTHI